MGGCPVQTLSLFRGVGILDMVIGRAGGGSGIDMFSAHLPSSLGGWTEEF